MEDLGSFEVFWQIYPRKVGKLDAAKSYDRAAQKTPDHVIRAAAMRYADECKDKEDRFVCHPATWLNQGRWLDEKAERPVAQYAPKQFPKEYRPPERPRATSWANVWVSEGAPQYRIMRERAERDDVDGREYRHDTGGIWVTQKWLIP